MVSPQEFAENFKKILPAVRQNKLPFFIVTIALISAGGTAVKLYDSRKLDSYDIDIKNLKRLVDEKDTAIQQNVKEIADLNQKLNVIVATRSEYALLDNIQLKEEANDIARKIRQADSEYRAKSDELTYSDKYRSSTSSAEEQSRLINERNMISSQLESEIRNKYNSLKSSAIAVRDEMIFRIQLISKIDVKTLENHRYENPVNSFGREDVALDLEQLANRLSSNFDVNASLLPPS